MRSSTGYLSVPKSDGTEATNEDRARIEAWPIHRPKRVAAAVSDGASQAWGSATWAEALAQAWVATPASSGPRWVRYVESCVAPEWTARQNPESLPWYAREGLRRGSAATFVGLSVSLTTYRYIAVAVGDAMLVHVRGRRLLRVYPRRSLGPSPVIPDLLRSRPLHGGIRPRGARGTARSGDVFLLMTDAMARWLARAHAEAPGTTGWWSTISGACTTPADFQDWVTSERQARRLEDDDVTLAWVKVPRGGRRTDAS